MNQKEFLNDRWNWHRDMNDAPRPKTTRTNCTRYWPHNGQPYAAHGGDWDRWEWRGEDYDSERAYCTSCGQMVRGILSPWRDLAIQDWYATPYMQRNFRRWAIENAYSRMRHGWKVQRTHRLTEI